MTTKTQLNPFTSELQKIVDDAGLLSADDKTTLELNIMLNAFDIAVLNSEVEHNMVDGMKDVYEDETGVDTANSIDQFYESANDASRTNVSRTNATSSDASRTNATSSNDA